MKGVNMGRTPKKCAYRIKTSHRGNICRIIEDEKNCNRETHCRGLCSKHHTYFMRKEKLEKYGAKPKFTYVKKSKYKINKKHHPKECRIIENGKACTTMLHGRGLCARHWLLFERHDLLLKYGTSSRKDPRTFAIKKRIKEGVCRMIENGKGCQAKSKTRGLCPKHYLRFLREDRLDKFGWAK